MSLRAAIGLKRSRSSRRRWGRVGLHGFLAVTALVWLFPIAWTIFTSFRSFSDTAANGYVSWPSEGLTFDNYINAWVQAELPMRFFNTILVVVPALVAVLLLASAIGYIVSHFSFRFNLIMLMIMTAGNLLPPQVIITPLYRIYLTLPLPAPLSDNGVWYDQYFGVAAIHVAFHLGFAVFVLSNYMKAIPAEFSEAAFVDGASVLKTYWKVILPISRPALAALTALEFTWMYNDFFWALILMPSGDKRPITTGLNDLQGLFFSDNNLLAAGALIIALPTLLVYLFAQRHMVSGLTMGAK